MSVDAACTSLSPAIPQPPGPHNNSLKRFRGSKDRGISFTIATQHSTAGRRRRQRSASKKSSTAARSPWQNAYAERLIGSLRRECLDHIIIGNARGLHRVLDAYVEYYITGPPLAAGIPAPLFDDERWSFGTLPPAASRARKARWRSTCAMTAARFRKACCRAWS